MKLGVYQCVAAGLSQDNRIDALDTAMRDQSLDLLVCPELFACGYNSGSAIAELAEPQGGTFCQRMASLARAHQCALVFGYAERAGNVIYNSAALLDDRGHLLANHRKQLPSPGSFEVDVFARGDTITYADLGGWRVAIIICYEVEFPENLRRAAQSGAHLVVVPTALGADWGVVAEKVVATRAYENGIYVAYASHAGEENGARYYGGSRIAAPDGSEPAVAQQDECVVCAGIERGEVDRMQERLPFLADVRRL